MIVNPKNNSIIFSKGTYIQYYTTLFDITKSNNVCWCTVFLLNYFLVNKALTLKYFLYICIKYTNKIGYIQSL